MQLTKVTTGSFAHKPVWSPAGQTLAYTLARPTQDPALNWLPLGIICGIDRETGKGRLLAHGAGPLESFDEAAWTDDSQALLLTRHQPQLDADRQFRCDKLSVIRYELAAQTVQSLVADSYSPALAPNESSLAYLKIDSADAGVDLMVAAADGQRARPVLSNDVTLGSIIGPRWSLDGSRLLFTASADNDRELVPPAGAAHSLLDQLLGVQVARAHGIPADLWVINMLGKAPQRVTRKDLDDPRAAWSPDGTRIVFASGSGGVVLLDLGSGREVVLTDKGDYGGISWASW